MPELSYTAPNQLSSVIEDALAAGAGGALDGYDSGTEALFALLVEAARMYAETIVATEADEVAPSLGSCQVDQVMLDDPTSFADVGQARFEAHLDLTLSSIRDNLVP